MYMYMYVYRCSCQMFQFVLSSCVPQVYNGVAGPFVMPPFATAGTPLYNVAGLRPVKMEGADWCVAVV